MNFGFYAELEGDPQAARQARDLARQAIGDDHPSADDLALVVSELVTNAVTHTRSGEPGGTLYLGVEVTEQPQAVAIRVRDAGTATSMPVMAEADSDGEHGRGLAIVAELAAEWGIEPFGPGRATWCRLTAGPAARLGERPGSQPVAEPGLPAGEMPEGRAIPSQRQAERWSSLVEPHQARADSGQLVDLPPVAHSPGVTHGVGARPRSAGLRDMEAAG